MESFFPGIAALVAARLGCAAGDVLPLLGPPKDPAHGDVALPCFKLALALGRKGKDAAASVAAEVAGLEPAPPVRAVEAAGPFVNFRLDPAAVARTVLEAVWTRAPYAGGDEGRGKTIVIDFSSPNVAKPFHLGHLRSTVIGWSLGRIFRALGHEVVGVNHLGDWGTQFGLMIAAWQRPDWRAEAERRLAEGARDVDVFVDLYVRINQAKKADPAVAQEGRTWFKRLEEGDPEARRLWRFFVERSLAEFARIYELLGITHESAAGESFYEDKMQAVLDELEATGLLVDGKTPAEQLEERRAAAAALRAEVEGLDAQAKAAGAGPEGPKLAKQADRARGRLANLEAALKKAEAGGAGAAAAGGDGDGDAAGEDDPGDEGPGEGRPRGVDLSAAKLGFCMLRKGDGGTTYGTRDLAAVRYRALTYRPAQVLYVVGNEQRDHFTQVFAVKDALAARGVAWAQGLACHHVGFGKYLGMSTRGGTAVFLDEVLERARARAREAAARADKKAELSAEVREEVARAIGTSAVKFFDLKGNRTNAIDLTRADGPGIDWDRLLSFEGDTGPYLQYAHARLAGILRKHGGTPALDVAWGALDDPEAQALLRTLADMPARVRQAAAEHEPSVVARYVLELSQRVNRFVHERRVIGAEALGDLPGEAVSAARLLLVAAAKKAMAEALGLLGIEALEQM